MAQEWFDNNGIEVLQWPSRSPDLSLIENLWWYLNSEIAEYDDEPSGMLELWQRIETEWNKIPTDFCMKLIENMPRRIAAVLKATDGYTKY